MKLFGGSASFPALGGQGSPRARWDEADPRGDTRPRSSACTHAINYHVNDSVQSLTPILTSSPGKPVHGSLQTASPSLLRALRHGRICVGKLLLRVPKYQFSHLLLLRCRSLEPSIRRCSVELCASVLTSHLMGLRKDCPVLWEADATRQRVVGVRRQMYGMALKIP